LFVHNKNNFFSQKRFIFFNPLSLSLSSLILNEQNLSVFVVCFGGGGVGMMAGVEKQASLQKLVVDIHV
jgi:hypothetical protein